MRTLFCFTKNLRLEDSPLLNWALANSDTILFVVSWRELVRRSGPFRTQFALESLADLENSLHAKNQKLVITFLTLDDFVTRELNNNIHQVVIEEDVNHEEQIQLQNIKALAALKNVKVHSIPDGTLTHFHNSIELFKGKNIVFTDFRKKVEMTLEVYSPYKCLESMPRPFETIQKANVTTLVELRKLTFDPGLVFKGGESVGIKHLNSYFKQPELAKNYKLTRNGMIHLNDSTKFSPWLSLGCINARTIYSLLKGFEAEHGANDSTYWIFFELLWRDYFKYLAFLNKEKTFLRGGLQDKKFVRLPKKVELHLLNRWKAGATGNDFIDANMIELQSTGWMSNRGRQNVSSYLVHELKVDWRLGAYYFEEMLIDYDCSSNWGNWSYISGVGTDPRNRVFNVQKQARDYDPDESYVRKWLISKSSSQFGTSD